VVGVAGVRVVVVGGGGGEGGEVVVGGVKVVVRNNTRLQCRDFVVVRPYEHGSAVPADCGQITRNHLFHTPTSESRSKRDRDCAVCIYMGKPLVL
jgi:hypothetical protein